MTTTATRSTPIGTIVDNVTALTASGTNEGPGGCIGWGELDANTAGTITTENALVVPSVPVNDSRLLKISACGTFRATGPTGAQILIFEDSTELLRRDTYVPASSVDVAFDVFCFSHAPSAGDHDYTLAYGISGSSGETINIIADSNRLCDVCVEDIGPDFS